MENIEKVIEETIERIEALKKTTYRDWIEEEIVSIMVFSHIYSLEANLRITLKSEDEQEKKKLFQILKEIYEKYNYLLIKGYF